MNLTYVSQGSGRAKADDKKVKVQIADNGSVGYVKQTSVFSTVKPCRTEIVL
ncbi:hypothetical protein KHA80_12780 [Anaerobacillus sp. HL2]|nr:hypothetical protein KHA80_12780 [Anaerobacillus sp. HL2]